MISRTLRASVVLPTLLLAAGAHAQSIVYKCVDKEGRVEFTDISKAGCKAIDVGGAISTPAPAPRTPAVSMRQGAGRLTPTAASPASFPRVDSATQRARDDDRRAILDEELRAEEKKLADLKRDAGGRDDIARAEKNVEAIKREIANIR